MLKLGIIGTNWISQRFVDAALGTKMYKLSQVYSRQAVSALAFANKHDKKSVTTNRSEFVSNPEI